MKKSKLIYQLMKIKHDLSHLKTSATGFDVALKRGINEEINEIVSEAMRAERSCESCPAMKQIEDLTNAIDQAVLISKEIEKPLHVFVGRQPGQLWKTHSQLMAHVLADEYRRQDEEKMARGGTD